jgi:hypothetical protein
MHPLVSRHSQIMLIVVMVAVAAMASATVVVGSQQDLDAWLVAMVITTMSWMAVFTAMTNMDHERASLRP